MPLYNELSDHELTALLNKGDEMAYAEIYNRYWAVLYRYSRRMLQSDKDAGDVIQDIFVMLWSKSAEIELKVSLSSFLYASVRNRILKSFERNKVHANYVSSLESFIDTGLAITDHQVRERELATLIENEIAALPPKMREVFELSRKEHLSYKEISEKLDISEHTVKKQISNSLKLLRVKLGPLFSIAITLI